MMKRTQLWFGLVVTLAAQLSWASTETVIAKASTKGARNQCAILFKKLGLCGELSWVISPQPVEMITEKDKAELSFTLCPRAQKFKKEAHQDRWSGVDALHVRLWMPSMGHGSRPTQVQLISEEHGCRKYRVENLYFTMMGDWEIQFEIKRGQKVLDQAKVPYEL